MTNNALSAFLRDIRRLRPEMQVLEGELLSRHCSFRIGGACDAMLLPASAEDIITVCRILRAGDERPLLMGNGTNLLFPDEGLHRIVLRMGEAMSAVTDADENTLHAECGATLAAFAAHAAERGLAGLEFAHGIPGTLGGGISMNAGAYGGEMKDVIASVTYINEELSLCETDAPDFSYRHSRFSDTDCVILSAKARLTPDDPAAIRERMRALMDRRRASQPLELPSAGSTFKRPVGGYAAALIDEAGLKGHAVGGAQVSEKHAGFVVNRGGATAADVLRLIEHIQNEVFRRSGIALEPEVKIIKG